MYLEPLPPIEVPFTSENPAKKDVILPLFFIPSFEDRPQDPIIERLKAETSSLPQHKPQDRRVESPVLDTLSAAQDQDSDLCSQSTKTGASSDIWEECLKEDIQRSFAISWDGFGSPASPPTTSAFFAEQPLRTFISAQNSVPNAGNARLVYRVKPHQLLSAVQMLLVGYSSPLFIFDPGKETFSVNMKHNQDFDLIVDGYSVSSTQSVLHRFCDIGTLIRRLDNYILSVRSQASSQTLHSLAHAIQQTNTYIKSEIEKSLQKQTGRVLELWEDQQRHERLLTPLAAVCGRDLSQSPPYHQLPDSETEILSLVYSHLLHHATSTSPREVQAIFAFILSKTSKHWQQLLNESLGLTPLSGGRSVKSPNDVTEANPPTTSPRLKFPNFIHKSASQQIFRGKRSLEILQKAKPDHPLCAPLDPRIAGLTHGWVWTEEEVERVIHKMEQYVNRMKRRVITWRRSGGKRKDRPDTPSPIKAKPIGQSSSSQEPMLEEDIAADEAKYKPELLGFTKFDLEPGTHFRMHSQAEKVEIHLPVASEVEPDLRKALATFPNHLPISTPTLGHLTQITVIEPLLAHSRLLSTSLLDLFLIDLHLLAHLDYVRRFALMGDQRFVANLRTALFDEWNNTPSSEISTHVREWGVGLSTTLSETGEWPPSQTRISFLLRQVIVDALDAGEQVPPGKYDEVMEEELDVLRKEAEWRIGFFIKNQDEEEEPPWMDSMAPEALDFLGIVYKPPQTLEIMMSADITEKYQRVFTFLLRLLRVETVTRSIFNMSFKSQLDSQLFSGNSETKSLFHSFRFFVQSFTSALTNYVSDIAIGANWRTFISKLKRLDRESRARTSLTSAVRYDDDDTDEEGDEGVDVSDFDHQQLNDVFSIIAYHEATLDKILTACLLKSRHRAARGALNDMLDLIFSFARFLRRVKAGMSGEKVAKRITELHNRWQQSMQLLVDSLRAMDEKGQTRQSVLSAQYSDIFDIRDEEIGARTKYPGVRDLLIRLDPLANQYNSSTY